MTDRVRGGAVMKGRKWLFATSGAVVSVVVLAALALGSAQDQVQAEQGQQIFQQNCAVCHGSDGGGGSGPPLAGNSNLGDAAFVINRILFGFRGMPAFGERLSNEEVAAVATHERTSWGNDFGPITAEQVEAQAAAQQEGEGGEVQAQQPAELQDVMIGVATNMDPARLVDADGRTLYRYAVDGPEGVSHCYAPCTNRWLPVLVPGQPSAGESIAAEQLGVVEREDGALQATYNGWPLYRFAGDEEPGEARGDEISDVWTSVSPDVEAIGGPGDAGREQEEPGQTQDGGESQQDGN